MSDTFNYRGGAILSYTILSAHCVCCSAPAVIRVVRSNDNPPTGYIKGGSIITEYCAEHTPIELKSAQWKHISSIRPNRGT